MSYSANAVAMRMVNYAIEKSEKTGNQQYLLSAARLHKLLYLAQLFSIIEFDTPLFSGVIEAHFCGSEVRGISSIDQHLYSTSTCNKPFGFRDGIVCLEPQTEKVICSIVDCFGTYSLEGLITAVYLTEAFRSLKNTITDDTKPPITENVMRTYKEKDKAFFDRCGCRMAA